MELPRSTLGALASAAVLTVVAGSCALFLDPDDYVDPAPGEPASGSSSSGGAGSGGIAGQGGAAAGGDNCGALGGGPLEPGAGYAVGLDDAVTWITALARRPNGDTIAAGFCSGAGSVDFGLRYGMEPCALDAESMFVVALDAALQPKWRFFAAQSSPGSRLYDVAATTDGTGDMIVTGVVGTSLQLGDCQVGANEADDIFVARIHPPGGTCVWVANPAGPELDASHAIAVSGDGVYLAGQFSGEVEFDIETKLPAPSSGPAYFAAKLDARNGSAVWVYPLGGQAPPSRPARLAVSEDGQDVWVAGTSSSNLLTCSEDLNGGALGFVTRIDGATGIPQTTRCFAAVNATPSPDSQVEVGGIVADATGVVVAASPVGERTEALIGMATISSYDVVVARLDRDTKVEWTRALSALVHAENPWSITRTPTGDFVAAGSSYASVVRTSGSTAGLDAFAVRLSPQGEAVWGGHYGDDADGSHQVIAAVESRGCRGVVVAGKFTTGLDPIDLTAPPDVQQGFAASLIPPE